MNLKRGLDKLAGTLEHLPAHVKLVFVGKGPDLPAIESLAASRGDDRLRVIGAVAHAEVFDVVRQADIGFVSYSMDSINEVLCAPNKVIEYAQAGLPMVATCQPTIRSIFQKYPMGRLVGCNEPVTSHEIADQILALAAELERHTSALGVFLRENTWEMEATALLTGVRASCGNTRPSTPR
jgi:glycosyltransferase involved in cell wall biosynthesis